MEHERVRLVERVDYITSSGFGDRGEWRAQQGLVRGGPSAAHNLWKPSCSSATNTSR